ncbi:MAG: ABC transporter substrate-binding protein [Minisyncoccales bacterium]
MSISLPQWPSSSQWRQFFKTLNKKQKILFFSLLVLNLSSFSFLLVDAYFKNTIIQPATGGIYVEGIVGSPAFINPLYAISNDADRDLVELIYAGLMKYNSQGEIIPDLTKEYKILEDGKVFEFYLKDNLHWSDGAPLTADDIIFTIKSVQNPTLKSPLRASWLDVQVEKVSDLIIRFKLKNTSANFLEKTTLKILPQHIWQNITEQNFPLSPYNLNPIGAGPYQIKNKLQDKNGQIKSIELVTNPYYYDRQPYIPKIIFFFFNQDEDLIKAFISKEIKGLALSFSPEKYQKIKNEKQNNFAEYSLLMPRYFAVFFNLEKSKILADKKIRQALNYATNKEEIFNEIWAGHGAIVNSPILPEIYNLEKPTKIYEFDEEKAQQLIKESGFTEEENGVKKKTITKQPTFQFKSDLQVGAQGSEVRELQKCLAQDATIYPAGEITGYFDEKTKEAVIKFQEKYKEEILTPYGLNAGTGSVLKATRDKLNQLCAASSSESYLLSFNLITVDQPILVKLASLLKKQWEKLGIKIEIKTVTSPELTEEFIRPRNYEMLLLGQSLDIIPDPFPFWHSFQIRDPGLNLSNYQNKEVDKLLEQARQSSLEEKETREMALNKFQNLLIEDAPAIFLYNPDFLYLVSSEIKGIAPQQFIADPSQRFSEIENWYIKTARKWK